MIRTMLTKPLTTYHAMASRPNAIADMVARRTFCRTPMECTALRGDWNRSRLGEFQREPTEDREVGM